MNYRKLISLFVLLLAGIVLVAQSHYGFKGGVNFAKVNIEDGPETDFRTSYNLGVFGQYYLSDNLYLQPEVMLTGKGYHYETTILGTDVKRYSRPLYIEIPILLHLHKDMGPGGLFANIGPYVSMGVGGTYYRETALSTTEEKIDFGQNEGEDEYRPLDLGLQVGGGFWINPGFSLTVFYDHGLYNVSPDDDQGDATYTRTIGVSLGYVVK